MDDGRVWTFEESLWKADAQHYRESIDGSCLMVVPAPPYVLVGMAAADAVADTPRWETTAFSDTQIARPQDGIIVIAYKIDATRGQETYVAHCSSVYQRIAHEEWKVIQHQQTPLPVMTAG